MKPWQTLVKYGAIAFAVILIVNICVWALTAFGFIFRLSSTGTSDEAKSFEFTEDIDELEFDISAAAVTIRVEECDKITVTTNLKDLTAKESGGKLTVKDKKSFITVTYSDAYIEIIFPADLAFDKVDIDGGAGRLEISSMTTDKLDLNLGAGEALIEALTVNKEADIEGGAGALTLKNTAISNLDLDMGVGELNFSGSLVGKNKIALGVGEASFELDGSKNDYTLNLQKGIGEITVDGTNIGNSKIGDGDTRIEIDGGIGNIKIDFTVIAE